VPSVPSIYQSEWGVIMGSYWQIPVSKNILAKATGGRSYLGILGRVTQGRYYCATLEGVTQGRFDNNPLRRERELFTAVFKLGKLNNKFEEKKKNTKKGNKR
jgi:hypothetical protein